jgi:hypothetical protein
LPVKANTIVVTGSKGKGSTARMVAWHLQQSGLKVGLIVSPEELNHLDRLRINNQPIEPTRFVQLVQALKPAIDQAAQRGDAYYYHSPADLFLLLGLAWFAQEQVDYVVLEGGRGAQFDLIGQIPARIGVVTSVFLEHAAFLGPDKEAIARDKLSLVHHCDQVFAPRDIADFYLPPNQEKMIWVDSLMDSLRSTSVSALPIEPQWLLQARHLATLIVESLGFAVTKTWDSPSFARYQLGDAGSWILDGAIAPIALDHRLLADLATKKTVVVMGLTRDKAPQLVSAALANAGLSTQYQIELHRGGENLSETGLSLPSLGKLDLQTGFDPAAHSALYALSRQFEFVYCVGVQLFLRNLRIALNCSALVGPKSQT